MYTFAVCLFNLFIFSFFMKMFNLFFDCITVIYVHCDGATTIETKRIRNMCEHEQMLDFRYTFLYIFCRKNIITLFLFVCVSFYF